MTFLDKFKGKTTMLTKQQVGGILGRVNSHQNTPPIKNVNTSFTVNLPSKNQDNKKLKKVGSHRVDKLQVQQSRIQKINPFSVSNPFYLDEQERQKDEKIKKDKEIKQRLERQRKKREEIEHRMAQFQKANKQKYSNKQWIRLGGLGPNVGTQEWNRKKQMQSKMMKFAEQIRQINFERVKCVPFMSYSNLTNESKKDSRTRGLQYSRSVPRPQLIIGQKQLNTIPRSESREQINQLQQLDKIHQRHMSLMKRI